MIITKKVTHFVIDDASIRELLAMGYINAEIARRLKVSRVAVSRYVKKNNLTPNICARVTNGNGKYIRLHEKFRYEELIPKIKDMQNKGMSDTQIAKILGYSKQYIHILKERSKSI